MAQAISADRAPAFLEIAQYQYLPLSLTRTEHAPYARARSYNAINESMGLPAVTETATARGRFEPIAPRDPPRGAHDRRDAC